MAPSEWNQYRPDPTPDGERALPTRSAPRPKARRPRRMHPAGLVIVAVGVVVAVGLPLLLSALGSEDGEPQTDTGFDALVDALREETGSTLVRSAVIYPEYASIDVPYKPDDPGDERELNYYWNGDLGEPTKGTGDEEAFDLAEVDSSVLADLCPQARKLVEDPEVCYLIIRKPNPDDTTPSWISAYASNEFSQSAWIEFGLDGSVVERHPPS